MSGERNPSEGESAEQHVLAQVEGLLETYIQGGERDSFLLERAISLLRNQYLRFIYSLLVRRFRAYQRTDEDAEDMAISVFLSLWVYLRGRPEKFLEKLRSHQHGGMLKLLAMMVTQTVGKAGRGKAYIPLAEVDMLLEDERAAEAFQLIEDAEDRKRVWEIIAEEDSEGILRLHYLKGVAYAEMPMPHARQCAHQVRKRVGERLEQEGFSLDG